MSVELDKINAIIEWSVPKNVTHIGSFMGIIGYYWKFIEGFSKIAYRVALLKQKGKNFEWTKNYDSKF